MQQCALVVDISCMFLPDMTPMAGRQEERSASEGHCCSMSTTETSRRLMRPWVSIVPPPSLPCPQSPPPPLPLNVLQTLPLILIIACGPQSICSPCQLLTKELAKALHCLHPLLATFLTSCSLSMFIAACHSLCVSSGWNAAQFQAFCPCVGTNIAEPVCYQVRSVVDGIVHI